MAVILLPNVTWLIVPEKSDTYRRADICFIHRVRTSVLRYTEYGNVIAVLIACKDISAG